MGVRMMTSNTMTPAEKLRRIADTTALDGVAEAIREVIPEVEQERAQAIRDCIKRLEQGFGADSAPVFVLRQHFWG